MNNNEKIPPTGEEREVLAAEARAEAERELSPLIVNGIDTMAAGRMAYAAGYVAGALRRSEVPEPRALRDPDPLWDRCYDDGSRMISPAKATEPQGEPSDAQVQAAMRATEFEGFQVAERRGLATLRAAGGVR